MSGADRYAFLQGQMTQDVDRIDEIHSTLSGWASPKGRLLAVGQLIARRDALSWPLPEDIVEAVARRLGSFVLRAKAEIRVADHAVMGLSGLDPGAPVCIGAIELENQNGAAAVAGDCAAARLIGDPTRAWLCGPAKTLRDWCHDAAFGSADANDWRLLDIRAGLPTVVAATSQAFIPQMLNLDLLGGISFTKGCYVGQEIVARTQNLGRIKRRMFRFRAGATFDLDPGATIYGPDNATGKVVQTASVDTDTEMTAVIAIEHAAENWYADAARSLALETLPLPYAITAKN
ncbi:MAG: YgfZ/GcvT domain-containing protein [Gammaproteobacteria bacterium]